MKIVLLYRITSKLKDFDLKIIRIEIKKIRDTLKV